MNAYLNTFVNQPAVQSLGWALLHFIWEGALLAAILLVANTLARRSAPAVRYAIGCVVMLTMLAAFLGTLVGNQPFRAAVAPTQQAALALRPDNGAILNRIALTAPIGGEISHVFRLAMLPGWAVCLWLTGLIALSFCTAAGWIRVQRLRRRGIEPVDPVWIAVLDGLMQRLQVTRPVRLYLSAVAQAPAVIGWIRPYILLPVSAMTGLSESQLRAILAHELAHIRRHDYLVNLLQNAVETLLFYHPAVWWVSRRIREERENCCDDLAVATCGDVMVYAHALAQMEELRGTIGQPALAATGGDLLARIRRLTGQKAVDRGRISGSVGAILAVALAIGVVVGVGEAPSMGAQSAAVRAEFEVASVKMAGPYNGVPRQISMRGGPGTSDPTRVTFENYPMVGLLMTAFDVRFDQIRGPDWLRVMGPFNSNLYDISAVVPEGATKDEFHLMLQSLLSRRFGLVLHHERKETQIYRLVKGPAATRLKPSAKDTTPPEDGTAPSQTNVMPTIGLDGYPELPQGLRSAVIGNRARRRFLHTTMAEFVAILAQESNRPVTDDTGITGEYDFELFWTISGSPEELDTGPDLATAVREQLGLRLESAKGLEDVLVVDHVDKVPTAN